MTAAVPPKRIVLIGAARSGTKILRDTLAAATGAGAVPYDIGFVWGAGIPDVEHDMLRPAALTPTRRSSPLRGPLRALESPLRVIEKTVGNTLRVPYVASRPARRGLRPSGARRRRRRGVDHAVSGRSPPTTATWREAAPLPAAHGADLWSSLRALAADAGVADDGRLATWGPRYPGIDSDLRDDGSAHRVRATVAWSVERATRDLDDCRARR